MEEYTYEELEEPNDELTHAINVYLESLGQQWRWAKNSGDPDEEVYKSRYETAVNMLVRSREEINDQLHQ